jgi:hypothetical protein
VRGGYGDAGVWGKFVYQVEMKVVGHLVVSAQTVAGFESRSGPSRGDFSEPEGNSKIKE